MENEEIFRRLADLSSGRQDGNFKRTMAFELIASFLQVQGQTPVPRGFKAELRKWLDHFEALGQG